MSLRIQTIRGIKWSSLQVITTQVFNFIIFVLLARLLSPESFGLLAIARIFTVAMVPLVNSGFSTAIVQRHELEAKHLDTAFWSNLLISFIAIALVYISADAIAFVFHEPRLSLIIVWLTPTFLFVALMSVQEALLRRQLDFKLLAFRSILATLAGGTIGIIMAVLDFGIWSLVGRALVTSFVSVLLLWKVSNWRPQLRFSLRHFTELFHFGISMVGTHLLIFFNRHIDNFVIGYFLGPVALGYYNIAYRFMQIVSMLLSGIIERVLLPSFSRLQTYPLRLQKAYHDVTQIIGLIAFPTFLGMCFLSPEIIPTFFGQQWTPSIPVLQVLAGVGLIQSLLRPITALITGIGKPFWRLVLQAADLVFNLIGFLIAVHWGIVAVATSYLIVNCLMSPLWLWAIYRLVKIDFRVFLRQCFAPTVGSLIMLIGIIILKVILFSKVTSLWWIVICASVGASLYLAFVYIVFPSLAKQAIKLGKNFLLMNG